MPASPAIRPSSTPPEYAVGTPQEAAIWRTLRSVALIDASPTGRIEFVTEKAHGLLTKYFSTGTPQHLPDAVLCWLNDRTAGSTAFTLSAPTKSPSQLVVRITGRECGHFQIQLEEISGCTSAEQLAALGLTQREAEVLFWIARGKTSSDIATILQCKSGTVTKHTERIFAKLGVETRTAAAAIALEKMGVKYTPTIAFSFGSS